MSGEKRSSADRKRESARHHEYNREYMRARYIRSTKTEEELQQARSRAGKASAASKRASGAYRLSSDDVRNIRQRHAGGEAVKQLAREYEVATMTISDVVNRKTWKDFD